MKSESYASPYNTFVAELRFSEHKKITHETKFDIANIHECSRIFTDFYLVQLNSSNFIFAELTLF